MTGAISAPFWLDEELTMNPGVPSICDVQALLRGRFAANSAHELFEIWAAKRKEQSCRRFVLGLLFGPTNLIKRISRLMLTARVPWPSADGRRLFGKRWRRKRLRDESRQRSRTVILHICHRNTLLSARPSFDFSTMNPEMPAGQDHPAGQLHLWSPTDRYRRNASAEMEVA